MELLKKKIFKYINKKKWNSVLKIIDSINPKEIDLNDIIINGNNFFHLACIEKNDKIMKKIIKFSKNKNFNINAFNSDGLSGIHLYYKYGGTSTYFLKKKMSCYLNIYNDTLLKYIINDIDLMMLYFDYMIKNNCIDNILIEIELETFQRNNIIYELCKKIYILNNEKEINKNKIYKYLMLLKKIILFLKNKTIIKYAIFFNLENIIKMLIKIKFNFLFINKNNETTLMIAIKYNKIEILKIILKYIDKKYSSKDNGYKIYNLINRDKFFYDFRIINTIIEKKNYNILKILIEYMKKYIIYYEKKYNKKFIFKEKNSYLNTYLHKILLDYNNTIPKDILDFFIKYTNLNDSNYYGDTPLHIIFQNKLWKEIEIPKYKKINIEKVDKNMKKIYNYIDNDDLKLFNKFCEMHNVVKEDEQYIDIYNLIKNNNNNNYKNENYGIFNANIDSYLIYIYLLKEKYPNIYIPTILYDEKTQKKNILKIEILSYDISDIYNNMKDILYLYQTRFYSYSVHSILWVNENLYFIHPEIIQVLIEHNNNKNNKHRFIIIKITKFYISSLHANILIYDRTKKKAWRFEPMGVTYTYENKLDILLKKILTKIYGKIHYYNPNDFLKNINFQLVSNDDKQQNIGDPIGYCLAWCLLFIEIIANYGDYNIKWLMKNCIKKKKIYELLLSEKDKKKENIEINYYLDFIRIYSHILNKRRNDFLIKIGISNYNIYNIYFNENDRIILSNFFKIKKID